MILGCIVGGIDLVSADNSEKWQRHANWVWNNPVTPEENASIVPLRYLFHHSLGGHPHVRRTVLRRRRLRREATPDKKMLIWKSHGFDGCMIFDTDTGQGHEPGLPKTNTIDSICLFICLITCLLLRFFFKNQKYVSAFFSAFLQIFVTYNYFLLL